MMGVHPVEWTGPKLEGLTLDLGELMPLPTELLGSNRHAFYSAVQKKQDHDGSKPEVDMIPIQESIYSYLQTGVRDEKNHLEGREVTNVVTVKVEKMDPVAETVTNLPLRTALLPTDLTPFDSEGVQDNQATGTRPITIDLSSSDSDSDGSTLCWSEDHLSEVNKPEKEQHKKSSGVVDVNGDLNIQRSISEATMTILPTPESPSPILSEPSAYGRDSIPTIKNEGTQMSLRVGLSASVNQERSGAKTPKFRKRKSSIIDLDSIIDLEADELDFPVEGKFTASEEAKTRRGSLVGEPLAKIPKVTDVTHVPQATVRDTSHTTLMQGSNQQTAVLNCGNVHITVIEGNHQQVPTPEILLLLNQTEEKPPVFKGINFSGSLPNEIEKQTPVWKKVDSPMRVFNQDEEQTGGWRSTNARVNRSSESEKEKEMGDSKNKPELNCSNGSEEPKFVYKNIDSTNQTEESSQLQQCAPSKDLRVLSNEDMVRSSSNVQGGDQQYVFDDNMVQSPSDGQGGEEQYVFDFGHDSDDDLIQDMMFDDEEDVETDLMVPSVTEAYGQEMVPLLPRTKDTQEELPSCCKLGSGIEEPYWLSSSVRGPPFSNLGASSSLTFEDGSGNATQMLQQPLTVSNPLNQQLSFPGDDSGQLLGKEATSIGTAQVPPIIFDVKHESPQLQVMKPTINPNNRSGVLAHDTADAVAALSRFVEASNARGTFDLANMGSSQGTMTSSVGVAKGVMPQGHSGTLQGIFLSGSMIPSRNSSQVATLHRENVSGPLDGVGQHSEVDNIGLGAESDKSNYEVSDNGVENIRPHGKNILISPKAESVELDLFKENWNDGKVTHVKMEWSQSSTMGPVLDSRDTIVQTLKLFDQHRLQMVQDQVAADPNGKRIRADLKVACSMRKSGLWRNENRPIGECPGVKVGDCFTYRIEMAVIGLHRAVQAGIAVVSAGHSPYGKPVAGSVVIGVSDTYKDDRDMGDTVVYSGQGGLCAGKGVGYQDQKLVRGNLALANSLELKLPVRLIRGHKIQGSSTGILYSYDGLYKVTGMSYDLGVHKNMVYTFNLERLPNQPPIKPPNISSMMYPTTMVVYPQPLGSHSPSSSQIPQTGHGLAEGPSISQVPPQGIQSGIHPTTSQTSQHEVGTWTGQASNSNTHQNEVGGWIEEYEVKPALYLESRPDQQ